MKRGSLADYVYILWRDLKVLYICTMCKNRKHVWKTVCSFMSIVSPSYDHDNEHDDGLCPLWSPWICQHDVFFWSFKVLKSGLWWTTITRHKFPQDWTNVLISSRFAGLLLWYLFCVVDLVLNTDNSFLVIGFDLSILWGLAIGIKSTIGSSIYFSHPLWNPKPCGFEQIRHGLFWYT